VTAEPKGNSSAVASRGYLEINHTGRKAQESSNDTAEKGRQLANVQEPRQIRGWPELAPSRHH
jgi:hypothetical protein